MIMKTSLILFQNLPKGYGEYFRKYFHGHSSAHDALFFHKTFPDTAILCNIIEEYE